ncbi:competence type IV pilus minor pilin ComGF [Fictibacillus nanhaiensis]|uniref:competence type IV pilus minor pilin ComGF n=1 Tax=Fictibacillus nanhaiensis TaxID=742169 RepID=UPI003C272083
MRVHSEIPANKNGYTLVESMIALGILIVITFMMTMLLTHLQKQPQSVQSEETALFFSMIGKEIREAATFEVRNNALFITLSTGEVISFARYHSLIRKQVNGLGHEVWVQNIQEMKVEEIEERYIYVTLTDKEGNQAHRGFRRIRHE